MDGLDVARDCDLLDPLPKLHELSRARPRMRLQPPPLGPLVGVVVVADVAEQQAAGPVAVDDQPDVLRHTNRPEVLVPRLVQLVELHPRCGRVQLQIEGGRLDGLLLLPGEPAQAVGERVSDAEVHGAST